MLWRHKDCVHDFCVNIRNYLSAYTTDFMSRMSVFVNRLTLYTSEVLCLKTPCYSVGHQTTRRWSFQHWRILPFLYFAMEISEPIIKTLMLFKILCIHLRFCVRGATPLTYSGCLIIRPIRNCKLICILSSLSVCINCTATALWEFWKVSVFSCFYRLVLYYL